MSVTQKIKDARYDWRIDDVVAAAGGRLLRGDASGLFSGISIDSRRIGSNDIFLAVRGEIHDGHDFILDVARRGIRCVVMSTEAWPSMAEALGAFASLACIGVSDTTVALGDLAAYHRARAGIPITAVTGSNGKTSTRIMTQAVLSQRFDTLGTEGNYNNEIGLPLTLLRLAPGHQQAVVELGMNHPGEIGYLTRICAPRIGVVTNIAPAHLEGVGTMEGVLSAKAELIYGLGRDGIAILNGDDPMLMGLADRIDVRLLRFGRGDEADIRAVDCRRTPAGFSFELRLPEGKTDVRLVFPGEFIISNALAAAAVGHAAGLSAIEIKAGIESFRPQTGRMNPIQTPRGVYVLDDTYNANPGSMRVAVETLLASKQSGRCALVLGDMLELGSFAADLHRKLGRQCAVGVDRLYLTGAYAEKIAEGAVEAGMQANKIHIGDKPELIEHLMSWVRSGDRILVKGSRGMKMETVVRALTQKTEDPR